MPLFSSCLTAAVLILSNVSPSNAQQTITKCPTAESVITTASKTTFRICPGTDYRGQTVQIVNNVADNLACTRLCDQKSQCTKAVFQKTGICHLKGQPLQWVADSRFDTIRIDVPADGTAITACPIPETVQSIGDASYRVCAGTDYVGASVRWVGRIPSTAACVDMCNNDPTCVRAVYDKLKSVCHVKDMTATLQWQASSRFDSINVIRKFNPAKAGRWSDIIRLPVIPVAAFIVPQQPESSRMLVFSSYASNDFGGATGKTQFADFNFRTGAVSQREVANTQHDMFCPGISSLEDGQIVITGGSNANAVSLYNPATNAFTRGPDMKIARGYQTSTTLSNGKIFTIGGSYSGGIFQKNGETYDPKTNQWTLLDGADVRPMLTTDHEGAWREDNHAWLYGWRNGSVFQAGPSKAMNWYGTSGTGSVQPAGIRDSIASSMCGVHVMYDAGKIFSTGGSPDYTNSPATTRAHLINIDVPGQPASVEQVQDMKNPRGFANAVVLPDGTVLVSGGQKTSLVFTDTDGVLAPELFNPVTKTFTELAPQAIARNYHSVSILLPDATVFSGGGGLCYSPQGQSDAGCNRAVDHPDGQIFSPPYLFQADGSLAPRPSIVSLASSSTANGFKVRVGGQLTIQMNDASGTTFALIRLGSVTHSINSDQRRIALTNVRANGVQYTVTLPDDSGVLIPGFYYLFAISRTNVPSIARTVQVIL